MKKKITLSIMLLVAGIFSGHAQVQFWSDTFEDAGAPSSGTRTPENNTGIGGPPFTAYFVRTNNAGINTVTSAGGGYLLGEGTKFWAGENHDDLTGVNIPGAEEQQIDFTGINISGKSNLAFRGLFAANNTTAAFETQALGSSQSDYVIVEYRIDGGSYLPFLRFYGNNVITSGVNNKSLALDTDGNSIGDGTILTSSFQEFEKLISGAGTTLDLRIRCYMNGGSEEWAIDNLRLLEGVLSTNEFDVNKSFVMYPNPNNGEVNIKSDFDGDFQVINQLGQTVKLFKVNANVLNAINLDQLSEGLYFVKGTNGTKISSQKLVIKK
jgi:hypothetical protein